MNSKKFNSFQLTSTQTAHLIQKSQDGPIEFGIRPIIKLFVANMRPCKK